MGYTIGPYKGGKEEFKDENWAKEEANLSLSIKEG